MKLVRLFFSLLAVILLTGFGIATAQTPGARVVKAMETIQKGTPKQLEDFVLNEKKNAVSGFHAMLFGAFAEKGGVTKFDVESEKIDGESAAVRIRWHYKNGSSLHQTFQVQRQDGKWRIKV